ncbi:MAG: FHA domain-containing protein, partial [Anaerolineales bacterium]|nr:FHA domain-containing protein [Anaerolineales bacterium]
LLPVLAAVAWWLWRRRPAASIEPTPTLPIIAAEDAAPDDGHVAVLSWQPDDGGMGEQIELTAADVTIGRDDTAVDIIVDAPSISRLHARIRRTAEGEYWLYDEGSEAGTFLNYERLGLAPRPLQHNDVVQLGRVTLRFRLELPRPGLRAATATADD